MAVFLKEPSSVVRRSLMKDREIDKIDKLREELRKQFMQLSDRVTNVIEQNISSISSRLDEVEARLDALEARVTRIEGQ